jgi:hypothetical protein
VSLAIPSLQLRLTTSLFSNLDSKLKTNSQYISIDQCRLSSYLFEFLYDSIFQYIILDEIYLIYFRCRSLSVHKLNYTPTTLGVQS